MRILKSVAFSVLLILPLATVWADGNDNVLPPIANNPEWQVGQTWQVVTSPSAWLPDYGKGRVKRVRQRKTVTLTYEVKGVEKVDGNRCFVVRMTEDGISDRARVYYFRTRDLTVKQLVEESNGKAVSTIANPARPFFFLPDSGICPLDFPRFPTSIKPDTWEGKVGESGLKLVQLSKYEDKGRTLLIKLRCKQNGKLYETEQRWEAGKPWWTSAKRTVDGKTVEVGTLVVKKKKE